MSHKEVATTIVDPRTFIKYMVLFCVLNANLCIGQVAEPIVVIQSEHLPMYSSDVQPFDWDNDGDPDMMIFTQVNQPSFQLSWYENLGNGLVGEPKFLDSISMPSSQWHNLFGYQDINLDGMNDYLFYSDTSIYQRLQIAPSVFDPPIRLVNIGFANFVSFGDVDGDGLSDAFITIDSLLTWRKNLGGGNYAAPVRIGVPELNSIISPILQDWDIDGDLDVVFANRQGIVYYKNLGAGVFGTKALFPIGNINYLLNLGYNSLLSADIDGDGLSDVVIKGFPMWVRNAGNGVFEQDKLIDPTLTSASVLRPFIGMVASDWDGDHDIDLIGIPNISSTFIEDSISLIVYQNNGVGIFTPATGLTKQRGILHNLTLVDWDQDGRNDVISYFGSVGVALIKSTNDPVHPVAPLTFIMPELAIIKDASPADIDGDGDKDIVVASAYDNKISWYANLGNDHFGPQHIVSIVNYGASLVRTADFDRDGDMDILATVNIYEDDYFVKFVWYENDGTGQFALPPHNVNSTNYFKNKVQVVDIDNDGNLDLVSPRPSGGLYWMRNQGLGIFEDPQFMVDVDGYNNPFEVVDLDGDGFKDIVTYVKNASVSLKLAWAKNSGFGSFLSPVFFDTGLYGINNGLMVGDLDGDGDLDVAAATYDFWIENLGAGNFSPYQSLTHPDVSPFVFTGLGLTDLDNDGDADLLHYWTDGKLGWYPNLGRGKLGKLIAIERDFSCGFSASTNCMVKNEDMDGNGLNDFFITTHDEIAYVKDIGTAPLIRGVVFWDENENGLKDSAEYLLPSVALTIQPHPSLAISGQKGDFRFYADSGQYVLSYLPDSCWRLTTDSAAFHVLVGDSTLTPYYFGFKRAMDISTVKSLIVSNPLVCNQTIKFNLLIQNTGCNPVHGQFKLNTANQMTFEPILSDQPFLTTIDSVIWKYDTIWPGDAHTIVAYFNIQNTQPGDTLYLTGMTNVLSADGMNVISIDTINYQEQVKCSYDPNDKMVDQRTVAVNYSPENRALDYTIRFQNTGTYKAFNIRIRDTLDANLDWATLRPIASSHPFETSVDLTNGAVSFLFPNICLPDSNSNEPESHGFVSYSIQMKPNLPAGTTIQNTAAIYFDFNTAILTNTTKTNIFLPIVPVSPEPQSYWQVKIFPNPTLDNPTVVYSKPTETDQQVLIFDTFGRLLATTNIPAHTNRTQLSMDALPAGLYFVEVLENSIRLLSQRIVKQ